MTRAGVVRAARSSDVLYLRVDGHFSREKVTALARLARPRPAVVWEINSSLEEQVAHGTDPRRVARWRKMRKMLATQADAAVVVSPELVGYARDELGIQDVTVVENGAEWPPEEAEPSALRSAGRFRALWMGSGHFPWHGFDTAVEAAARLEKEHPGVVVALVDADGRARAPATSNLIRLAPASRQEAAAHLAAADCVLCLYHDTPWAPGGFTMSPIKLFEAWSAGRPVIATALGSIRRLVEDGKTGLLVGDDPGEVADAIVRLRRQPALRRRLAEAGRERVRDHYNWDRAADELEAVLQRVTLRMRP
jgi:glycosyltransferase involved in cell wall biosynthesis